MTSSHSPSGAYQLAPPREFMTRTELAKQRTRERREKRMADGQVSPRARARASRPPRGGCFFLRPAPRAPAPRASQSSSPKVQLDAKVNNFLKGWGEGSADLEAKLQRKREEEARLQAQRREKLERERRKARDDINAWSQVYQVRPARARERDASAHLLTAARERERAGGLLVLVELGHGRGDHDVSRREAAESEGAQAAGAEAARRCQRRRSRDGRACLSQPRIRGASIRQRARALARLACARGGSQIITGASLCNLPCVLRAGFGTHARRSRQRKKAKTAKVSDALTGLIDQATWVV